MLLAIHVHQHDWTGASATSYALPQASVIPLTNFEANGSELRVNVYKVHMINHGGTHIIICNLANELIHNPDN